MKNIQCVETYHLSIAITGLRIFFLSESTEGVAAGQTTAMDYENEENRTEKWEKREEHWADWTKISPHPEAFEYVCRRCSAYRRGQSNVENTYQGSSLCYVLLIVSGKNRHINDRAKNRR